MSDTNDPNKTEFQKGGPGGPGRRRKRLSEHVEYFLQEAFDVKGAKRLVEAMDATKLCGVTLVEHPDWPTRVHAFEVLRDTLYGRPPQAVTNEDGSALRMGIMILPNESNDDE